MGGRSNRVVVAVVGLMVLGLGAAGPAEGIGPRGIEGDVGYVNGEDNVGGSFILAGFLDLGEIIPNLAIEGGADFWTKSYDVGFFGSSADWRYTNIGILGGVRYDVPLDGSFSPFAFGGLGLHVARVSGESSYHDPWTGNTVTEDASETDLEFGIRFGGGLAVDMSPGMAFVGRLGFDFNGGADYFFLTGGVKIGLGK